MKLWFPLQNSQLRHSLLCGRGELPRPKPTEGSSGRAGPCMNQFPLPISLGNFPPYPTVLPMRAHRLTSTFSSGAFSSSHVQAVCDTVQTHSRASLGENVPFSHVLGKLSCILCPSWNVEGWRAPPPLPRGSFYRHERLQVTWLIMTGSTLSQASLLVLNTQAIRRGWR